MYWPINFFIKNDDNERNDGERVVRSVTEQRPPRQVHHL